MAHVCIFLTASAIMSTMMAVLTTAGDPFPLFKGYSDFQQVYNNVKYNTSYWLDVAHMKKGCICEGEYVVCYDENTHYVVRELIRDDLNTEKRYKVASDLDCLTCLAQESAYFGYCAPNNKIPVKEFQRKDLVSSKSLESEEVRTETFWITNAGKQSQTLSTNEYETSITNTDSVEYSFGAKLTAKTTLKIPLVGSTELSVELTADMKKTHTVSEQKRMKIPSKEITVPAYSRVNYTWTLYKATREFRYSFTFEIEEQGEDSVNVDYSELKKKLLAQTVYANLSPRVKYDQVGITLTSSGNLVAENIGVRETRTGHETMVYISDDQPIP